MFQTVLKTTEGEIPPWFETIKLRVCEFVYVSHHFVAFREVSRVFMSTFSCQRLARLPN